MPNIQLSHLAPTGRLLIGRASELAALDKAWHNPDVKIVSVIGIGGIGKTTLVGSWLGRLSNEGFTDVDNVFSWSFYDNPSADGFFAHLLHFLGSPVQAPMSSSEQVHLIINHLHSNRTLLVLDGFERLQDPETHNGRILDVHMSNFVRRVAIDPSGRSLCLITSRYSIPDIENQPSVKTIALGPLSEAEGSELLRQLGTTGTAGEIAEVVREYGGSPLSLQVLGAYLARNHSGDVRQRSSIDIDRAELQLHKPTVSFDVWVDPGTADVADIEELFRSISSLSRAYGGAGLVFTEDDTRVYSMEAATQ